MFFCNTLCNSNDNLFYIVEVMRDHQSHDILLMCVSCHQRSNILDTSLRQELADECDAPIGTSSDVKQREDSDLKRVRSAARALLKNAGNKIPAERAQELASVVKSYYNVDELSQGVLEQGANCDTA